MKISKRTRRDLRIIEAQMNATSHQSSSSFGLKNVLCLFPARLVTVFFGFINFIEMKGGN
jgi:hypothetical protein